MTEIMPGAEPFFFKRGSQGVLLTHGFTASPQEVHEMGSFLADEGFTVLGVRLAGHGTSLNNLAKTHWQDWLHSMEDGYAMLQDQCKSIVLAGFSTGGVLSLMLSTMVEVAGVITMSTPIDLPPRPIYKIIYPFLNIVGALLPPIPKGPPDWIDKEALKNRVAYEAYDAQAVYQFGQLVRQLKPVLPKVHAPLLMMHSTNDDFIPVDHMYAIYNEVNSRYKETFTVDQSGHIITCDADRLLVFQKAAQFIQSLTVQTADFEGRLPT